MREQCINCTDCVCVENNMPSSKTSAGHIPFYNPRILSGASPKPRLTKTMHKRTVCKRGSRTVAILPRLDRCPVARNQSLREPFIHGPSLFQQPSGARARDSRARLRNRMLLAGKGRHHLYSHGKSGRNLAF